MPKRPRSNFDPWAAEKLGLPEDELTIEAAFHLPRQTDLLEGSESPLGGRLASHLVSYSEKQLEDLARMGDELLKELSRPTPSPTA
jgi:hypothetical protein